MLTATKGLAVMNTIFKEYAPWAGDITMRDNGSLVSFETGQSTAYALESIQNRGKLFIASGLEIYKGQVIGIHQRQGDMEVNACKKKQVNNMRRCPPPFPKDILPEPCPISTASRLPISVACSWTIL